MQAFTFEVDETTFFAGNECANDSEEERPPEIVTEAAIARRRMLRRLVAVAVLADDRCRERARESA